MKHIFSLSVAVFMGFMANASAQAIDDDAVPAKRSVASQSFILSQISSIGVDTLTAADSKAPGQRHEIRALYEKKFSCPPDLACVMVMPAPARRVTVVLRESVLANTDKKARVLNICRRTIEQAGPGSRVLITGKLTETSDGNRVVVHSLESCSVGSAPE